MNKYKILTLLFLLVSIGVESKADTRSDNPLVSLTDSIIDRELIQATKEELIQAAKEGDINKVKKLVQEANIDAQDDQGRTPLHWAAINEHLEVVDVLLNNGASTQVIDNDGNPAEVVIRNSEIRKKIRKAREQALFNPKLIKAAKEGDINKVKELVQQANINAQDNQGRTPLHWAAMNEHPEVVDVLLDNGASTQVIDNDGRPAILLTGNFEIRKKISKAREQDLLHEQLVEAIKQEEDIKRVKELVDKGAKVYARGDSSRTLPAYLRTSSIEIQKIFLSGNPCRSEFKTLTN